MRVFSPAFPREKRSPPWPIDVSMSLCNKLNGGHCVEVLGFAEVEEGVNHRLDGRCFPGGVRRSVDTWDGCC